MDAYQCLFVAYQCLSLPITVAYGCLWLPMHRATIKKRLAEAPALAPAWRSCCGWGHLLLPAVSTGAVQQLGATGVTAPLTTPGFFKERDFQSQTCCCWQLFDRYYPAATRDLVQQLLSSTWSHCGRLENLYFVMFLYALFESMKWGKETFSTNTYFSW